MGLWEGLNKLFGNAGTPSQHEGYQKVPDQIIGHLFSLIEQKSLVTELVIKYRAASTVHIDRRLVPYIGIYTALERFVTEHRPPITTNELTVPELRESIRAAYKISELPEDFRLIFLPEQEQAVYLCAIGSRELIKFLANSMGLTPVQGIFNQVVGGTFLKEAVVTEHGLDVQNVFETARTTDLQDIVASFKILNASLFQEIINVLGEKSALELIERVYTSVKERYDTALISRFLEALPLGVLESERATFLSKEDLGRKIQERTAELLEAQRELRLERDRAKAIISSIGEGLITLDAKRRITSLNAAAERLLDLNIDDVLGNTWEDYIEVRKGAEDKAVQYDFLEPALKKGEMVSTGLEDTLVFVTKQKSFPVATITTPLSRNGIAGAVIVFRDITQEKEANDLIERTVIQRTQEVQEGRARLIASINSLKLGFIMTDHDLKITIKNAAADHILALPGQADPDFTFNDINKLFAESIDLKASAQDVLNNQKAMEFDSLLHGKQYLRLYLSPITHKSNPIGCAILIEDVTEARVLERSKDEFFTIASHELRTPLIAIRGYASMIKEYFPDKLPPKELIRMVDRIDTSGSRLINIVNSFLDVSRLEQGKMEFKEESFDLSEVITVCLDELRSMADDKKVTLKYTPPAHLAPIVGDKNLTKQVLYNLVGNGIKFTEKGEVGVHVSSTAKQVAVSVQDTGVGIPADAQALLFRKFQQTGDSLFTRDNSQGTGLGLYISKLIVEGMGGTIELEKSVAGKGSTFVFTIPRTKPAAPEKKKV